MSDEYPKALYIGNTKQYGHAIAKDEDQEKQLREDGYLHYSELKEPEVVVIGKAIGSSDSSGELPKVKQELLNALKTIEQKEEEILDWKEAHIAFSNNVAAMKARIAELQGDTTPVGTTNDMVDYGDWSADQLREEITKQGKSFKVRDSKAELIQILIGKNYGNAQGTSLV